MHTLSKQQLALALIALILVSYFAVSRYQVATLEQQAQDQKAVLLPPGNTPDEAKNYQTVVEKLAIESETLEVGANCTMSPLVIKLKEGSTLAVHNGDTASHVIAFEDQNFFSVSAGRTRDINLKDVLSRVAGTYRYRCSDRSDPTNVGVVYVVK